MNSLLFEQIQALDDPSLCRISRLANAIAAIYCSDQAISWAGLYYIRPDGQAELGPFQGKPACMHIDPGKGVIGTCVLAGRPVLVEDVHAFPGHIACDSASQSEIVLPIFDQKGKLSAVLDLDSDIPAHFTAENQVWLEKICSQLSDFSFCVTL